MRVMKIENPVRLVFHPLQAPHIDLRVGGRVMHNACGGLGMAAGFGQRVFRCFRPAQQQRFDLQPVGFQLHGGDFGAADRKAGTEPQTVIVHAGDDDVAPLTVDVMPLPRQRLELRFDARALLVVRSETGNEQRRATVLRDNFGFTPAEVQIALALVRGMKAEAIAKERGVSVGTVRVQIKSLLAKAGVNRQMELVARVARI